MEPVLLRALEPVLVLVLVRSSLALVLVAVLAPVLLRAPLYHHHHHHHHFKKKKRILRARKVAGSPGR